MIYKDAIAHDSNVRGRCRFGETEEGQMTEGAATKSQSSLPEYYQNEFQKIRDSNEQYKGKWNWAAFLAGPVWAYTKGLQAVVVVYILAIIFTFGISIAAYAVIFGLRGNYMYYTKLMKSRNLIL
jgi:hypothetical protein